MLTIEVPAENGFENVFAELLCLNDFISEGRNKLNFINCCLKT